MAGLALTKRAKYAASVLACTCLVTGACSSEQTGGFTDVAPQMGLRHATFAGGEHKQHIRESLGNGACWIDYDNDADPDLLMLNGSREAPVRAQVHEPWRFYENRQSGFLDVSAAAGFGAGADWALGCAVGDVNDDGFDDLYITTAVGPNRLFVNVPVPGGRSFEDAASALPSDVAGLSAGAAFADLDGDGDLDLFVTHYLDESKPPAGECDWKGMSVMCGPKGFPMLADRIYFNEGGRFVDRSDVAGIADGTGYGLGVVIFDADRDGDQDVYVANDSSPNRLWFNDGRGRFADHGLLAGVAYSAAGASQAGMGVDTGDLDGDGLQDIVVTNFSDDVNNYYRRFADDGYLEWSSRSGLAEASYRMLGWSVLAEDFDLDGDLDLFVANGHVYPQVTAGDTSTDYLQRAQLLRNDGSGRFTEEPQATAGLAPSSARSAAAADFDGDGDMDIVVTRDQQTPWLLRNDLPGPDRHWLSIRLDAGAFNHRGLGAKLTLSYGDRRQYREVRANRGYLGASETKVIFGLGSVTSIDALEVEWPDGVVSVATGLAVDQVHTIRRASAVEARP